MFDRLEARSCPVCGAGAENAVTLLKQSLDRSRVSDFTYASRKIPEFMSFELVTCGDCETVYAPSAPAPKALACAYHKAHYDSAEEAKLAADAYDKALSPYLSTLPSFTRALEIGTGSGVFLSTLRRAGFAEVVGIEPSRAAIDAADPQVRRFIREGIFVESDFQPESFGLICCFQTLEHVPAPRQLVESCARLLQKGGLLVLVTHDYRAPINRALGRRSPIIDIEHLQLFCRPSLRRLLSAAGLEVVGIRGISNRYPLRYWLRLAPLPTKLKSTAMKALSACGAADLCVKLNVGNLMSLGRKPI
jgi:SAM-dependent methyltransferase